MLLLPDFYAFYGDFACSACVGSYLIDSGFRCVDLLAGGCPAASNFLLLRQKKVTKEKATRLPGSLRFASGNLRASGKTGVRANSPAAQTARGPDPVFPDARRPRQNGTDGNGCGNGYGYGNSDENGHLFSCSFPLWGKAGMGASGGRTLAGQQTRKPLSPWRLEACFQFAEPPSQPSPRGGRGQYKYKYQYQHPFSDASTTGFASFCTPDPLTISPARSVWACDDLEKRDQGGALFERNEVERVCADPRFFRSSQVARSEAKGPRQPGRLFFGDFLLAKQKKVTCRRATPGQPNQAKLTQRENNTKPTTGTKA